MVTHYDRYLPHILPPGETVFITFRLHGSLPAHVIERLIDEKKASDSLISQCLTGDPIVQKQRLINNSKRYFQQFDEYLDVYTQGNDWLKQPLIADLVQKAIHYHDNRDYTLHAYCIMSNHVHLLATIIDTHKSFFRVLKSLKGFTARKANELLNRTGEPFWQPESYDHVVTNSEEHKRVIDYILNNPVKAGLSDEWTNWPYSYLAER